jgi:hypothetical protein
VRPLGLTAVFAAVLVSCASCRSTPVAPDVADAGEDDACARACGRLAALGCPEAEPTDAGATCVEVCRNAEASGVVTLEPDCVADAATCDDIDRCFAASP